MKPSLPPKRRPLVERLKDIANRHPSFYRAFPHQFYDIGLQVTKNVADAASIRSK